MDEQELKHWGILGMKWGIRRYQNEDGSLTPQGRERYGVGVTKNVKGVNDAGSLSNEELRDMQRRYRSQAEYYKARNDYLYEQKRYGELTAPKKKQTNYFLQNTLGKPIENVLGKTNEAVFGYLGGALISSVFGEKAGDFMENYYYKTLYGNKNNGDNDKKKDKKQDDKQNTETSGEKNNSDKVERSFFDNDDNSDNRFNMYWDKKDKEFVFQISDDSESYNKDDYNMSSNKTYPWEASEHESKKGFGAKPIRKR